MYLLYINVPYISILFIYEYTYIYWYANVLIFKYIKILFYNCLVGVLLKETA